MKLRDGATYRSRRFGCPVTETYHFRVKVPGKPRHAAASSPLITVRIR